MLWTGLYYERITIFTRQQYLSIECNRRSRETRRHRYTTSFILHLTGLGIETRQHTAIRSQVEIVAVKNWRGDVRGPLLILPSNVVSEITSAAQRNRHRDLRGETGGDENHVVVRNRRRNRIALHTIMTP